MNPTHLTEEMNKKGKIIPLKDFTNPKPGMVIGFKSYSNDITAAYPIYSIYLHRITFVLFYKKGTNIPVLDATHVDSCFINQEPIVHEINQDAAPSSFTS